MNQSDFESLNQENLAAMADGLNMSAELKQQAAQEQLKTAKDMATIAAIANGMHSALAENTETMRDMRESVVAAADRAEDASNLVFQRVEDRAVQTLKDVDKAARMAIENSQRSAQETVSELEAVKKAALFAIVATCAVVAVAGVFIVIVAIGALWTQFKAGAEWLSSWGWVALPLSMAACITFGAWVAKKLL